MSLLSYCLSAVLFVAIDFVWLMTMVSRVYRPALGSLLLDTPNFGAAAAFYLVYPVGLAVFGVENGLQKQSIPYAFLYGALFGGLAYATYNLTNLATLRGWSLTVVFMDTAWGAFASGLAAALACAILLKIGSAT